MGRPVWLTPNTLSLTTLQSRCAHSLETEDHYSLDRKMFLNPWRMFSLDILERMLFCSLSSVKMQREPTLSICRIQYIYEFTYLLKFVGQNQYLTSFCGHLQTVTKNFELLDMHAPSWGPTRQCFAFCFSSHPINECPFQNLFSAILFTFFCAFSWWFRHWKWPQSVVLKFCLVFWSARKLWCGKECVRPASLMHEL